MIPSPQTTDHLAEMPLWRLLVLLADLEREAGPTSPDARLVARLIQERLRGADGKGAGHRG
jgi:hypothetical protein